VRRVSFFHSLAAQEVFRAMFCRAHGRAEAVAKLADVPHWVAPIHAHLPGGSGIEGRAAFLPAGYFYSMSTPVDPGAVEAAPGRALALDADCVLYPVVGDAGFVERLRSDGYVCIPWFFESSYVARDGLDADLRASCGAQQAREIRRLAQRYDEVYEARIVRGAEIGTAELDEFDRLHRMNLAKYHHGFNFYDRAVLAHLLASELGAGLILYLTAERHTRRVVHGLLALIDPAESELVALVLGSDAGAQRAGQNLYVATQYTLLEWAEQRGVRRVSFGRGNQRQKVRLGANTVTLLHNGVKLLRGEADLAPTVAAMTAWMRRELSALSELVGEHRAVTLPTAA
jgi:hypothetical protein